LRFVGHGNASGQQKMMVVSMTKIKGILISIFLLLCFTNLAYAQDWSLAQSPEGNEVRQIYSDGNSVVIAVPGAYFWSENNGDSWSEISNAGLPDAGNFSSFWSVVGLFEGRLFAYNTYADKKLHCLDLGESAWTICDESLGQIVSPKLFAWNNTIFLVLGIDIYASTNNGSSWNSHSFSGVPGTDRIQFAKALPSGTRLITTDQGVYVQASETSTFTSASGDLGTWYKAATETSGNLYLMSGASLIRSTDDGATWTEIVQQNDLSDIASDGTQLFLVSRREGVMKMSLDGSTKDSLLIGGTNIVVNSMLVKGNAYFASTLGGLYRTNNPLGEWTRANSGIGYAGVRDIVASGDTLYAATTTGVWRSLSYGQKWSPTNSVHASMSDVATYEGTVYAASSQGVWVSEDGGESFSELEGMPTLVDPTVIVGPQGIFVSSYQGSENGTYSWNGSSWQTVASVDGALDSWFDATSEYLYIGKFVHDGTSWSSVSGLGSVGAVYSYAQFDGDFYAGTYAKIAGRPILFSAADGKSFSSDTQGLDNEQETTNGLCTWGDSLIAAVQHTDSYKLYIRPDAATEFLPLNETGLPADYSARDVVCTPYGVVLSTKASGIFHMDFETPPAPGEEDPEVEYPPLAASDRGNTEIQKNSVNVVLKNGKIFLNSHVYSASLVDLSGNTLWVSANENTIDVSDVPAGVYMVRGTGMKGAYSFKVIIH